ncbi:10 kDa chaperonin [Aspergillus pseudocaelatus]|uniref:10 kDa chaperonin n=1 Tax=Aspergillus pseudocaelatus TaxID=1825620 RepID=A0ABQ6X2A3_9EURO|nr:10 kDa chaperonin [Aspergillus pseudocaelatus]
MKIRPSQDRLIVKVRDDSADAADSSLPETKREKPLEGKVVAVGKGKVLDDGTVQPLDVREGDTILFSKDAGTEIKADGESYTVLKEDEIVAIIES